MPTYTFIDTETDEEFDVEMKINALDEFKKANPKLKQKLTINVIGGLTQTSGSLPEGFKDKLREMKKKHPRATGLDNHI